MLEGKDEGSREKKYVSNKKIIGAIACKKTYKLENMRDWVWCQPIYPITTKKCLSLIRLKKNTPMSIRDVETIREYLS